MALNNIAWVGRFTGPKGDIAHGIMREVAPQFPDYHFTFIGVPLENANVPAGASNIQVKGYIENIVAELATYDLIIGAGRVALEAMSINKPVIAIGENRYIGPVDARTIALAKATNFGDCDRRQPINMQELVHDLQAIRDGNYAFKTQHYADYLAEYDADTVYRDVMDVYGQASLDHYLKRFNEIPVLTYHRVVEQHLKGSKYNVYITAADLEQQIIKLKHRGFNFTTFRDLARGDRPKKPIILTFDDGYEDNYRNLLPLLQKHDAKAVIYALADRSLMTNAWDTVHGEIEAPLMSNAQLRECHQSGYIEIGSHGCTHQHLTKLDTAMAEREIAESKSILEGIIGDEVVSFAYPYGDYADREAELVKAAGYSFGIGTVSGPLKLGTDRYRVRRITMFPHTKPSTFWKKTSGFYLRYCKLKGKDF